MPNIQRIGDANDAGGVITQTPQSHTKQNGLAIATNGSIGTSHNPCNQPRSGNNPQHCQPNWQTANGDPNFLIDGLPVNFTGNADTCAHHRVGGDPNFVEQ